MPCQYSSAHDKPRQCYGMPWQPMHGICHCKSRHDCHGKPCKLPWKLERFARAVSMASNGSRTAYHGKPHGTPRQVPRHAMASPTARHGKLPEAHEPRRSHPHAPPWTGSGWTVGLRQLLRRAVRFLHLVGSIRSGWNQIQMGSGLGGISGDPGGSPL